MDTDMGLFWEILEYLGEFLVFIGVVFEVVAEWKEPHRARMGRIASLILIAGLAISLAALVGTCLLYTSPSPRD